MHSASPGLALVVAEWFDGEHRHRGPHTFRVDAGRIVQVEPGDHGAALAAQGWAVQRGAFLMPGLVDAHVHLFLDGGTTDPAQRSAHLKQEVEALAEAARASARQTLACGVTLVRDAGDRHGINNRVREEARRPGSGLAQVRSGGLGVKRARRYGAFMATDVDDADSIRSSVRGLAAANDEIKLILTGIIDFEAGAVTDEPQFDVEAARLVVQTAHACGRKVFAHCSGAKGLAVAAAAGIDCIEHGFFMSRDILARMCDQEQAWTPTFCPVHFQWAHSEAAGWSPGTVANLRRILDSHAEHVRLAHEMGVTLLLGTDAGSMGVEHGRALFEEIERFLEAGLPMEAVLQAATAAPRRHFGAAQPRLVAGAPFDAVLLAASPFDNPGALRRPQQVWSVGGTRKAAVPA
ncbi:amidohydrolase family protein [Ramlibacter sp.]|uniref:amidohydrolase family protein n=1 Tax=Ramlibacter sp. TaxID=1917967 RepID=UPI002D6BA9E1|nr:amidohydrolase family protein [Ramlibacter sp.]HYD74502.1 amidohydrolase family protein [Ramlibacter sp.]